MADRPLLLFPSYDHVQPPHRPMMMPPPHRPDAVRQGERLSPIFQELQSAFEARRVELQVGSTGIDPEQVLVFETIGSVDDFIRAIKAVPGLEWMGELEVEDIAPDQDFYVTDDPEKALSGRLYLVMTNQRAMAELVSLWEGYQKDPQAKFQRGQGKFKDLFKCLKDIRRWDLQDRLLETNLLEVWQENLSLDPEAVVRFEAELWYRRDEAKRSTSVGDVVRQVAELGGRIVSQCIISDIGYHGLLGELPAASVRTIAEHPSIQTILASSAAGLAKCESIMSFHPVGQMAVGKEPLEGDFSTFPRSDQPLPNGRPTIALLDGVPMLHHDLLDGRLYFDDPADYQAGYRASEQNHGTAMASLILHGDLSESGPALSTPLYVRPILQPDPRARSVGIQAPEIIPEDILPVDLIHMAVRRMMEGDGEGQPPIAPGVRIINLSIGDHSRQFDRAMSPLSRLVDWLSHRYGLLFVISAGNHNPALDLELDRPAFEALTSEERELAIVRQLHQDARNRRLRPPAESLNGLTVGAAHQDASVVAYAGERFDPFTTSLPSPISSFGSGYRRSIKPDLIYPGGKQWFRNPVVSQTPLPLNPSYVRAAPGIQVASPSLNPGERDKTSFLCGTSPATALITRAGAHCLETLATVVADQAPTADYQGNAAPLVKAMIVHGCSWGTTGDHLEKLLSTDHNSREVTSWVSRWLGYGLPDVARVLECTAQRATVMGYGALSHDEAHVFSLPLPPSLSAITQIRKLTITLAWLTPVLSNTQKYRAARLWFEQKHDLADKRQDADWQTVRRGTVQHEVFEGKRAVPFADGDFIKIQINCLKDAGEFTAPIPYGLVVTLEVAEGVNIAVYDEIKARIATPVQVQQRVIGPQE
jgi:hypothetical protein